MANMTTIGLTSPVSLCIILAGAFFPESASEGFSFSRSSPGDVDRAPDDVPYHGKSKENQMFF